MNIFHFAYYPPHFHMSFYLVIYIFSNLTDTQLFQFICFLFNFWLFGYASKGVKVLVLVAKLDEQ